MRSLVGFAFMLAALALGCGPVNYIKQVPGGAAPAIEAAQAEANDESPEYLYWNTLAVEYLRKAREEAALADYQAANRFGRLSEEAAKRALQAARDPQLSFPEGFSRADQSPGEPAPADDTAPPEPDNDEGDEGGEGGDNAEPGEETDGDDFSDSDEGDR